MATKAKPRIIRVHVNRPGIPHGLPWTVHTSQGCFPASHVQFVGEMETEEKPKKKDNPRYFLKCRGVVFWQDDVAIIYAGSAAQ